MISFKTNTWWVCNKQFPRYCNKSAFNWGGTGQAPAPLPPLPHPTLLWCGNPYSLASPPRDLHSSSSDWQRLHHLSCPLLALPCYHPTWNFINILQKSIVIVTLELHCTINLCTENTYMNMVPGNVHCIGPTCSCHQWHNLIHASIGLGLPHRLGESTKTEFKFTM